ncbi:conserved protein of unknown function [Candidatus Hydrogenisulfobacillus filiaventi]|uniref:Uncharacterized protein n=1 Tax=Candidatus Hydrogenisulfobacillus filiaventi TaxID=2707344 RepID=A0A6F8ZH25_9FIRM|nr:hypothetical protein [Bacillota bacterium]CAB1128892.1 conserved protein of unknown function [Candidatus Hydrogenisulfobacillus filiaventi]
MGAWRGQAVAALLLGLLAGGGWSYLRLGGSLAGCQAALARTRAQVRTLGAENRRLEDALAALNRQRSRGQVIRRVQLRLLASPLTAAQVEAALAPYLEPLLGTSLQGVQPELVYRLLAGRILTVGNGVYRLEVAAVLLAPDTVLLVRVVPLSGGGGPG